MEFFCHQYCLSEGFYIEATKSGEGDDYSYRTTVVPAQYIFKPVYQPVGVAGFKSFDPEEQLVVVRDENIEGVDFTYRPIGERKPKIDVLIVAFEKTRRGLPVYHSREEKSRLEAKISQYQLALAEEGLSSYFDYLNLPTGYNSSQIRGELQLLFRKFKFSYLILIGREGEEKEFYFPPGVDGVYDIFGDMDGDGNYLLDIPIGIIPQPHQLDIDMLVNYFETITQLHRSGGLDLANYQSLYLGGAWTTSLCLNRDLFGKECARDSNCKNSNLDCTLTEADGKGFFLLLLHGSNKPWQKFSTSHPAEGGIGKCFGWERGKGFTPSDLSSINLSGSFWMALPCFSGLIDNKETTSLSVPMTFFKKGGAVYLGNTRASIGSKGCPFGTSNCRQCLDPSCESCSPVIPAGDGCSGTLFLEIAKRLTPGKRIGDAFLEGKNYYYHHYDCPWEGKDYVYHISVLFGDPTLKVKNRW